MLTGLKAPMEKIREMQAKAVKEQEAMRKKTVENKADLSEFNSLGDVFSSETVISPIEDKNDFSFL